MSSSLAKTAKEIEVIRRYFEEHDSPSMISRDLKLTRQEVFRIVGSANLQTINTIARAQISGIVRDSVAALAALAEEVRGQAEEALSPDPIDPKTDRYLQSRRRNTIDMYRTMYECVAPLMQEFVHRERQAADIKALQPVTTP